MEYFYEDILYQIFLKLPGKSLLRLKSLSKYWNLVFSNTKFVREHLKNMAPIDNHKAFILQYPNQPDHDQPPALSLLRMDSSFSGHEESLRAELMECPLETSDEIWDTVHCDGILCMFVRNFSDYSICVFNPITMEHKRFPLLMQPGWEAYGFGYDSVIDEYKVIHIKGSSPGKSPKWRSIGCLRLKTGSWDIAVDKLPCCFIISFGYKMATTVNGCLYWIGEKQDENDKWISYVILCFDLEKETIREEASLGGEGILYENYKSVQYKGHMRHAVLGVLGNSLCLARTYNGACSDLFTMEENEVTKTKCWKKIVTIQRYGPGMRRFVAVDPICVTRSGQVLGNENRKSKLFLFNQDGLVRKIAIHGLGLPSRRFNVIPYVESLVSPT